jgi:hypothetical protein
MCVLGGVRAEDDRYLGRFLQVLAEYEEVQDRLSAFAPDDEEIGVLIWPDWGDWIFDRMWEGRQ